MTSQSSDQDRTESEAETQPHEFSFFIPSQRERFRVAANVLLNRFVEMPRCRAASFNQCLLLEKTKRGTLRRAARFASMAMKKTLLLFDVDGTLTVPRKVAEPQMLAALDEIRKNFTIGVVGGSDLPKQKEQLGEDVLQRFDYVFSENGLLGFHNGKEIHRQSLVTHLGNDNIKRFVKFVLRMIADLDIPVQRGTFIELRNGMFNVSPIGRNCSQAERDEFEKFDLAHGIRKGMIAKLQAEFADLNLKYSVGGQISFDVFPIGWDKTYCLQFVKGQFDEIHFFGDKTYEGGNDFEIYTSPDTIGHAVTTWEDTVRILTTELAPKAA